MNRVAPQPGLPADADAPPFHHNPSSFAQRGAVAGLAAVAAALALYMGAFQWGWIDSVWDPVFGSGSETVLRSEESDLMYGLIGIPDSILGFWAYSTEIVLAFAGSTRRWHMRPWLVLLFGLDVIPLGIVSAGLVVVQGVVVGAWCFPCLLTAAISLALVVLVYDEVWASIRYLREVWRRDPRSGSIWWTVWGRPSPAAIDVAFRMAA